MSDLIDVLRPFRYSDDGAEQEAAREMISLVIARPIDRPQLVAILVDKLQTATQGDARTQIALMKILGAFGGGSPRARILLLTKALVEDGERVRAAAADAFLQGGPPDAEVRAQIVEWLRRTPAAGWSSGWKVLERLTELLERLPTPFPEELGILVERLEDEDDLVRQVAARTLGRRGQAHPAVVDALIRRLDDEYAMAAIDARNALIALAQTDRTVKPRLEASLGRARSELMARELAFILGALG